MSRKILTTFLEQNPWSEVAEKDETTRKEVQIVSSSSPTSLPQYLDTVLR
jgi:hypothetical protein